MAVQMAQQHFDKYKQILDSSLSDKSKPWAQAFEFLEKKTCINRSYIFLGKLVKQLCEKLKKQITRGNYD